MNKICVIIILTILSVISIIFFKPRTYRNFVIPDKIVLYNHGKERNIEKGSYLYNNILSLTDKRFGTRIGTYLSNMGIKELEDMEQDEVMLVFTYSNMKETTYNFGDDFYGDNYQSVTYKKIFMPLSGTDSEECFLDYGDVVSRGTFKVSSPDDLVKILNLYIRMPF